MGEKVLDHHTHVLLPLWLQQNFFKWGLASPPHLHLLALQPRGPSNRCHLLGCSST